MTVAQLKDVLRERGLSVSGKKEDLIRRLKGGLRLRKTLEFWAKGLEAFDEELDEGMGLSFGAGLAVKRPSGDRITPQLRRSEHYEKIAKNRWKTMMEGRVDPKETHPMLTRLEDGGPVEIDWPRDAKWQHCVLGDTDSVVVEEEGEPDLLLYEVVVAAGSRLEGKMLREIGFRERYGGVVLALRRRAEDMEGGLGRVPLRAGDLLLVEGRRSLADRLASLSDDFALVSPVGHLRPVTKRAPVALALLAGAIGLSAFEVMPLATATFAAALGMVVSGCLRGNALRRAVDLPVLIVIGAALGIGKAVETTGLAAVAATGIEAVAVFGPVVTLLVVYGIANGLAELITNKASAVLMLPVALAVAADLGVDWVPFAVAVTVGSAASFLTPIGYQTNLMVLAPGGYRYTDFTRAGLPVSLIVCVVTITMCVLVWL